MRVTKEAVIQAASEIANEQGLNQVSLKAVAKKLNIRAPSLYNHIGSLEELLRDLAHSGMREMNSRMVQAAIGTAGDTALRSIGVAYIGFVIDNPGVYDTMQWVHWHSNQETAEIFGTYQELLEKLISSCNFKEPQTDEIRSLLTSVLHGYSTMELGKALDRPNEVKAGLVTCLDTVLLGLHTKYS